MPMLFAPALVRPDWNRRGCCLVDFVIYKSRERRVCRRRESAASCAPLDYHPNCCGIPHPANLLKLLSRPSLPEGAREVIVNGRQRNNGLMAAPHARCPPLSAPQAKQA
jgi:hypothetical protein